MSQGTRLLTWCLLSHKAEGVPTVFKLCSQRSQEDEEGLWTWGLWQGKLTEIPPEQLFLDILCPWYALKNRKLQIAFGLWAFIPLEGGYSFFFELINLIKVFIRRKDTDTEAT